MNLGQLGTFTENLAKMLDDGIMFDRAIEVASGCMTHRANRKFAADLREALLENIDLTERWGDYKVPPFYLAMLRCGQLTGRLPEALKAAGYFIGQLMPLKVCLKRCVCLSVAAILLSVLVNWIFTRQLPVVLLGLLATVFLLPVYIKPIRRFGDLLLAKLPFFGTWSQQLSLLEFFLCLEISYESTLTVRKMFEYSIAGVGNSYFRRQMAKSLEGIDQRNSFSDSLAVVAFIPRGIIAGVHADEISGTLEKCFHAIASELKKLIEAKLEPIKALATGIVLDCGLLLPLLMILPLFIADRGLVILAIAGMMGFVEAACARMAVAEYLNKAAEVNLWWEEIGR